MIPMIERQSFAIGQMRWVWASLAVVVAALSTIAFLPGERWLAFSIVYFSAHILVATACVRMALRDVRITGNELLVRNLARSWRLPLTDVRRVDFAPAPAGKLGGSPFLVLSNARTIPLGALTPLVRPQPDEMRNAVFELSHAISSRRKEGPPKF